MRQAGNNPEPAAFRGLLLRLRDGQSTEDDWRKLLTRAPSISNQAEFKDAVRLFFDKQSVAAYNYQKLTSLNTPIARISAKHSGTGAATAKSDDAGGLDPEIFLTKGAQVMLTSNLWQQMGLCNGSPGTVHDILFAANTGPPDLPIAVLVHFPHYTGPAFMEERPQCVPVPPQLFEWDSHGSRLSRLQVPLRLRYAMTIHKSQGQTLSKVVIDLGKSEKAAGCTFVAASRVRSLDHALFQPMTLQRLQSIGKGKGLKNRMAEDGRLAVLAEQTCHKFRPGNPMPQTNVSNPTVSSSVPCHEPSQHSISTRLLYSGSTNVDDIQEFVHSDKESLHCRVNQVRSIEPAVYNGKQVPERHIMAQLHPVARTRYTAVETNPDGNCLWHMVSLGLTGTEELTADLRLLTVLTLVENEQYFRQLLSLDNHRDTFASIVREAATWGAWGGEFHLHALSLALNRPIYVYSAFHLRDGSFPYQFQNFAELCQLFLERADHTRQHLIYQRPGEPLIGRKPIMGYFAATPGHYTAILPNWELTPRFIPTTNLFRQANARLLSQHFR